MALDTVLEHDFEPAPGLPESLPEDERLLWQGKPDFGSVARSTFHVRKLLVYFGALLVLRLVFKANDGVSLAAGLGSSVSLLALAGIALGMLLLYAGLIARSTVLTITNRRIVIRAGVAVPMTLNLPFARIEAVDLRLHGDGSGDIAILTEANSRVSYVLLWPFVKPWRFMRVRPVLRGIADARPVADLLCEALAKSAAPLQAKPMRGASSKEFEASGNKDRPRRGWLAYPTFPLAAAGSLVVVTLVAVAVVQAVDAGGLQQRETVDVVAEARLYFNDRADGSVVVLDAADGNTIDILEPGTNGFLRSTMRTFVRERKATHQGNETPFSLRQSASGRLVLADPATGREVDLWAFGKTNAEAFRRLLQPSADEVLATITETRAFDDNPNATAVAQINQENQP